MLPSIPVDEMDFLPQTTYQDILDFQFSSWYPQFKHISIKSKVVKPLNGDFKTYLLADGVQIPLGSDDKWGRLNVIQPQYLLTLALWQSLWQWLRHRSRWRRGWRGRTSICFPRPRYPNPTGNQWIRSRISQTKFLFTKGEHIFLHAQSATGIDELSKDASWILPSSSPLKCTSPSEVYMLLKSSDFISHDLTTEHVFEGCKPEENLPNYQLELILRKWYHVDPSREFRCFVRSRKLIGSC